MKHIELSRELKKELWRLFDAGIEASGLTVKGRRIPQEAIDKQLKLHAEFRVRHPNRKKRNELRAPDPVPSI
jgi:hypothetical protein